MGGLRPGEVVHLFPHMEIYIYMYVYMDDCMRAYLPTAVAPAGRRHRSVWRTPQAVPGGPYRASRPRCRPATTPTGEPPAPPNPPPTGEDGRPRAATNWWHQGSRPPRGPAAQGPRRQLASEARHRPAGGCHAPRGRRAPMSAPRQLAGRPRRRGRGRGARPSWDPPPSARRCRARWWEVSHTNLAKVGLTLSDS